MRYGLIGEKLGHSYSKIIHEKLADYNYDLIPLTKEEFVTFMEAREFKAINVTIPYKQDVIPYVDELHPLAKEIGAVNTIVNENGTLKGYNTDFYGFEYMLMHNNIKIDGKKCLILGYGGSARTVHAVLNHMGAKEILTISRKSNDQALSYEECYDKHKDAAIIVNTTPLGMYPTYINDSPLDLTDFRQCEAVIDLIYNPGKTKLTLQAATLGIQAVTGLEMLVAQAKQAIEYFIDTKLPDEKIETIYRELLQSMT